MLVLSRKLGEQFMIDGGIVVTVVGFDGNRVRLGVKAPLSVRIDRAEVHERRATESTEVRRVSPKPEAVLVGS